MCGLKAHITDIYISTGLDGNHGTVYLIDDIVHKFSDFPAMNQHLRSNLDERNVHFESIREHLIFGYDICV